MRPSKELMLKITAEVDAGRRRLLESYNARRDARVEKAKKSWADRLSARAKVREMRIAEGFRIRPSKQTQPSDGERFKLR